MKKARNIAAIAILLTTAVVALIAVLLTLDTVGIIGIDKNETDPVEIILTAPNNLEQGTASRWQLKIKNTSSKSENLLVRIGAKGVDLSATNNTAISAESADDTKTVFGEDWTDEAALDWRPGVIKPKQTASLDIDGLPTLRSGEQGEMKVMAYNLDESYRRCGFAWLKKCDVKIGESILGEAQAAATVTSINQRRDAITLSKGFNLATIPVYLNDSTLSEFWGQFTRQIGWHLDATSQTWENLAESKNYSKIQPGVGMWLYHSDGGEVLIPDGELVSSDENFEISLSAGWNQIGNPYKYRIKLDSEKILVRRDGKDDITLGGAAQSGVVKNVLGVASAEEASDSEERTPKYIEIVLGRYLPVGAGFFVNTSEPIKLVFPGEVIFAPGELISSVERARIISWINNNGLDICGNMPSTSLADNPLRDSQTGEVLDQFDCILINHPERPWNN